MNVKLSCLIIGVKVINWDQISFIINWHKNFTNISEMLHDSYQDVSPKYLDFKGTIPQSPTVAFRYDQNVIQIITNMSDCN